MPSNLYEECVKAGVKIENHYSDLYIPVNEVTRLLVLDHIREIGAKNADQWGVDGHNVTTFKSNIDNSLCYDIPFAYLPYWQEKEKENDRRRALDAKKDTH